MAQIGWPVTFMNPEHEIEPPWVKYPSYPPGDTFWRQSGEPWFVYVWQPYWDSLNSQAQDDYLVKWKAPESWRLHFSSDFQKWLYSEDD